MFDTITAIATGNFNQPISIIRISGAEAFQLTQQIFDGQVGKNQTITYGYIKNKHEIIDEVLISWFKAPHTFTGEDIVEINAHGGVVNTHKILRLILNNGARLAERGEFTHRAFLNKKIDLVKAEAIHDLIFAKTEEQAKLSIKKFDGKTSALINNMTQQLLTIIATIETNIDYPEYDDIEHLSQENIMPKLQAMLTSLQEIKESSRSSKYIYQGIHVGIIGRPNVGKSSLLNAILGEDKAIVTNMPGTTRDIVEGNVQIGQILFNFSDTAGIHFASGHIEKIGIQKSLQQITKSDLILHVIDSVHGEGQDDKLIAVKSRNKVYIKIFNKSDLQKRDGITTSAIKGDIAQLFDAIKSKFKEIDLNNDKIITNTRQLALIDKSINNIETAIEGINSGLEPDEVILDIRNSWKNISNIIGKASDEAMLDEMFKNFCLGK